MVLSQNQHPKPSDFVPHVVPNVWGTILERCRTVWGTRNLAKVLNLNCAWTNKIAQHQSAGDGAQPKLFGASSTQQA